MDAVIINRISSQQQTDGYSLEAQARYGEAYAKEKGFVVLKVWTFQETASKPEHRKIFQEILNYIDDYNSKSPKKKLAVVVEKPDRLYRNHQDKEWCQEKYLTGKVEFHFYKDHKVFDETSSPTDIFMDDIITSLNKYTAKNIGREALKGMREKCEQGWFPQQAPFGYKNTAIEIDGRKLKIIIPHPEEAPIVKLMFDMRVQGKSFEEIRQHVLKSSLLQTNRVGKFRNKSSVEFLLKNPFYTGAFQWRGQRYNGKHEPLVSKEVFEKARTVATRVISRMGQKMGVLSNWINCHCGCKVTYDPKIKTLKTTKEQVLYKYYRCSNGKKLHDRYLYLTEDKMFTDMGNAVNQIQTS